MDISIVSASIHDKLSAIKPKLSSNNPSVSGAVKTYSKVPDAPVDIVASILATLAEVSQESSRNTLSVLS